MESILQVNDLKISFHTAEGRVQAVRGISFGLQKGEMLAVVGESGSGKSAAAKAIMGILPGNAVIESGEAIFEGRDLLKLPEAEYSRIRGRRIAMVFQDPMSALDPIMKTGRQIAETMILNGTDRKTARARALRLMEEVGIGEPERRFEQYPFELSGGMRQRVVIAAALAADPDILICDEPTTSLDVTVQAQILELIGRLRKERGLSVIFITHDLGVAAGMADRIAVMYAGRFAEIGTAEDIFYRAAHPYTWALLSAVPDPESDERLETIPGAPPDMTDPPKGDAFAPRNKYAQKIDFEEQPPMFRISDTHSAATWLLRPGAEKADPPKAAAERMRRMKERQEAGQNG